MASNTVKLDFGALRSPIIFRGDAVTAYRDPAAVFHEGLFRMFFTVANVEPDGGVYLRVASSSSPDLLSWSEPSFLTPKDRSLNFSSPGNLIRFEGEWLLCLQTYPRPKGEMYGNASSRVWLMRSEDLESWSEPEIMRVKGPGVRVEDMGRMIDPYLLEDKDEPGKWWCLYKQNGVSLSWTRDFKTWRFAGSEQAGENVCALVEDGEYVLFHSPENGIGVKRSADMKTWRDTDLLTLGQSEWPWSQGRLTAGFVLDLREDPSVGKALMFFHGSDYPETDPRGGFDSYASIAVAWSSDLKEWSWPGKKA